MPRLAVLLALASAVLPVALSLEEAVEEEICEGATCAEPRPQQANRALLQTRKANQQLLETKEETRAGTDVEAKVEGDAELGVDEESAETVGGSCCSFGGGKCGSDAWCNGAEWQCSKCSGQWISRQPPQGGCCSWGGGCGSDSWCNSMSSRCEGPCKGKWIGGGGGGEGGGGGGGGACKEWCQSDIGKNGKGRHCTGDMTHFCGGCSYCNAAPAPTFPPEGPGRDRKITVKGRQVLVDGVPIHLKGVCWGPVPKGKTNSPDFKRYVEQDAKMMKEAGVNAVRTYGPIWDKSVLDVFWKYKIWVIMVAHTAGNAYSREHDIANVVKSLKDHPAILMWSIGNEWNYNKMYSSLSFDECVDTTAKAAEIIKKHDNTRPVSTIYGEVPDKWLIDKLSNIDVWGINVYRGKGFGDTMQKFASRSGKPLYYGEYGADAWNAGSHRVDEDAQADATRTLTELIWKHSSTSSGETFGGFVFEWNDEWWKDGKGSSWNHDVGGIAPGGGPWPDMTFNEEYWGLVTVDRKKRKAFWALAEVKTPKDFAR